MDAALASFNAGGAGSDNRVDAAYYWNNASPFDAIHFAHQSPDMLGSQSMLDPLFVSPYYEASPTPSNSPPSSELPLEMPPFFEVVNQNAHYSMPMYGGCDMTFNRSNGELCLSPFSTPDDGGLCPELSFTSPYSDNICWTHSPSDSSLHILPDEDMPRDAFVSADMSMDEGFSRLEVPSLDGFSEHMPSDVDWQGHCNDGGSRGRQYAATDRRSSVGSISGISVSGSGSGRKLHACTSGNCRKIFSRQADLYRHVLHLHTDEAKKARFECDYPTCPRKSTPFHRKDHFRYHLRDQHREDLLKRGSNAGQSNSRPEKNSSPDSSGSDHQYHRQNPATVSYNGSRTRRNKAELLGPELQQSQVNDTWWRCSRCLERVNIETHEWTCPCCRGNIEEARKALRINRGQGQGQQTATGDGTGLDAECSTA